MGLFQRIKAVFNQSEFDRMISEYLSGEDVSTPTSIDCCASKGNASLKFSALFACFRVLAETFATVPLFEYRKINDDGDKEKTNDTGLMNFLHGMANEEMSSYNWKEAAMYQLCAGGNSISVRIENTMGSTVGLYPLEWQNVKIDRDDNGKLIYKVRQDKGQERIYYRDEVFHLPGPSMNGVTGMSIIEYAAAAINLGMTYEGFGNKFFKNGALPSGIFEHPGELADTAFNRLRENIEKNWTGLNNTGKPLLLEDGLKFSQLTMKLADAELLSSKKFQVEDICRFCRVPLHLVQNLDRATNNNIEHQSLEFIMYTMLPHYKRAEECINTQLLSQRQRDNGYYYEFKIDTMLRGDLKSRYEAYAIGRNAGFLSVNDILRLENRNGIGEKGDIYLQPLNMIEAGTEPEEPKSIDTVPDKVKEEIDNLLSASR